MRRLAHSPEAVESPATPCSERDAYRARFAALLQVEPPPDLPEGGRLAQLAERFGLATLDTDVLALLWVGAFDPALRAKLASREAYSGQITVRLVTALCGHLGAGAATQ